MWYWAPIVNDDIFDDLPKSNWDPPERERTWYRNRESGQLAYLVTRGGKSMIRLDRPDQEIVRQFHEAEWIPEVEHRPVTRAQCAQVAYEADLKLCLMLGDFQKRQVWHNLHEDVRIRWTDKGPPARPAIRQDLFRNIMQTLERVAK